MFQAEAIQVEENRWRPINRPLSSQLLLVFLGLAASLPPRAPCKSHAVKDTHRDMCTSDAVTHVF